MMIHQMAKHFMKQGHHVRVLLHQAGMYGVKRVYSYEGIDVFPPDKGIDDLLFGWADCVFTHLDYTKWTVVQGNKHRKPVFFITHNTSDSYNTLINWNKNTFVIYNSHSAKQTLGYTRPGMVVHPPCDWRHYDDGADHFGEKYITLINLDHNKGGAVLKEIAKRMPDRKFLGVIGSYSAPPDIGQITDQPGNVKVIPKTTEIREVYKETRILIMPSEYESWGRTATEAMCSGIPVISTETFGLKENCGDAGIYCDRNDIDAWVKAIKKLDDRKAYKAQSKKCRERSRELDPINELNELTKWVSNVVTGWNNRN